MTTPNELADTEVHEDDVWCISMVGGLGYTCEVHVSCGNAKDELEAKKIAGWMFPELTAVDATRCRLRDVSG